MDRLRAMAPFIAAALLGGGLAGCVTKYPSLGSASSGRTVVYRPVPHPEIGWERMARLLEEALGHPTNILTIEGESHNVTRARVLPGKIAIDPGARGRGFELSFDRLAEREIVVEQNPIGALEIQLDRGVELFMFIDQARKVADGLLAAQQGPAAAWGTGAAAEREARLAAFGPLAQGYRAQPVKPPLSEDQRRLVVQAEAMREDKDYPGAIARYETLVKADPTAYPEGYYNLALLSEQVGDLGGAIFYMRMYLMIRPDGPDARAAQDRIYKWEYQSEKK